MKQLPNIILPHDEKAARLLQDYRQEGLIKKGHNGNCLWMKKMGVEYEEPEVGNAAATTPNRIAIIVGTVKIGTRRRVAIRQERITKATSAAL